MERVKDLGFPRSPSTSNSSSSSSSSSSSTVSDSPLFKRSTLYILIDYNTAEDEMYRAWYSIDPIGERFNSGKDKGGITHKILNKTPLFTMPRDIPEHCACVTMGSKLYALGGLDPIPSLFFPTIRNTVFSFDIAEAEAEADLVDNKMTTINWENLPSMLLPRSGPSALVIDGKLFVMGSNHMSRRTLDGVPWSEVYDPINKYWCPLSQDPPEGIIPLTQTMVPSANCLLIEESDNTPNLILMYFEIVRQSFIFYPKLGTWKEIRLPFALNFHYSNGAVVVKQVIFMVTMNCICAFDLVNCGILDNFENYQLPGKHPKAKVVRGLDNDYPSHIHSRRSFFHLGNMDFCLVWGCVDNDTRYTEVIHCLRFHIDREENDEWLASVLSHDLYSVTVPDIPGQSKLLQCVQVRS